MIRAVTFLWCAVIMSSIGTAASAGVSEATDRRGFLIAFERSTGEQRWRVEREDPIGRVFVRFESRGVVVADVLRAANTCDPPEGSQHQVVAFDAQTGEVRWSRGRGASIASGPGKAGDVVVVRRSRAMEGIDVRNGSVRWTHPTEEGDVLLVTQRFAFRAPSEDPVNPLVFPDEVHAIDRRSGERAWTYRAPPGEGVSVIGADGETVALVAFLPDARRAVRLVDAATGSPQRDVLLESFESTASFVGGVVIEGVPSRREVRGVDVTTGAVLWDAPGTMIEPVDERATIVPAWIADAPGGLFSKLTGLSPLNGVGETIAGDASGEIDVDESTVAKTQYHPASVTLADLGAGRQRWSRRLDAGAGPSVALGRTAVYVGGGCGIGD